MVHLNSEIFEEEVIKCKVKVLVMFTTEGCAYCKNMEPLMNLIQREITDVKFCTCLADRENELAGRYSIRSVPVCIVFENGQEKCRKTGQLTKKEIYTLLSKMPANTEMV